MKFLTTWRERLAGAVMHHPAICVDPVLGSLEQIGGGLWQTVEPVLLLDGLEPVGVTIESEILGDAAAGSQGREAFLELKRRYPDLRNDISRLLCSVAPRIKSAGIWEHALLATVEIWHEPATAKPVIALEYVLSDGPEYTYTVRVENWHAIDVVVSG